jgi:hypothetical protein
LVGAAVVAVGLIVYAAAEVAAVSALR